MRLASPDLLFLVFLFIHIGGAIVAFGPTYAFPLIGSMGGREREHANFGTRLIHRIATTLVIPVAIVVGLSGLGLIWTGGRRPEELWLALAIVLYVIAIVFAIFVSTPTVARLIEASGGASRPSPPPAAGPAPPAADAGSAPPAADAGSVRPAGPPPQVAELVRKVQRNGMIQGVLLVAILLLMVFKPQLG